MIIKDELDNSKSSHDYLQFAFNLSMLSFNLSSSCWIENGTVFSSSEYSRVYRCLTEWVLCLCIRKCCAEPLETWWRKNGKMKIERHEKNRFDIDSENSLLLVCVPMILILFILYDFGKYYDCKYIQFCLCSVLFYFYTYIDNLCAAVDLIRVFLILNKITEKNV